MRVLGMDAEMANEIGRTYFYRDRHNVKMMAEVYDPKLGRFENDELIKMSLEADQKTMLEIQQIMNREK